MIFTVSASFASENVTDVQTLEDNAICQDNLQEVDNSEGNFSELQSYIDSKDDEIIYLEKNYTYEQVGGAHGQGVIINKSVTIDGKGHTIDANFSSRIFYITHSGVVLKNITFANGNIGDHGSGIYTNCDNTTIIGCNFIDNHQWGSRGGAIYFGGGNNTISDSYFTSLESSEYIQGQTWYSSSIHIHGPSEGAAVYFAKGDNTVSHSIFRNNHATDRGGALYFAEGNNLVEYSTFINNTARYGGFAIEFTGSNNRVVNSRFEKNGALNYAEKGKGVIEMQDNNEIIGCNFTGNNNTCIEANSENNIVGCLFEYSKYEDRDSKKSFAGAISINSNNNVSGCTFNNNYGDWSQSGSIQAQTNNLITNCNFTGNSGGTGGAISADSENEISNCIFENNEGRTRAGAIYLKTKNNVSDCTFINNSASDDGGAVYAIFNNTISDCGFENNSALRGGAVFLNSTNNILKSNFTHNMVIGVEYFYYDAYGGAIYINAGYNHLDGLNFIDNTAVPFTYVPNGYVKFTKKQINETHYSLNIYFDWKNIDLFEAEFYDANNISWYNPYYSASFYEDYENNCTYMVYSELYYPDGTYEDYDVQGKNITIVNQTFVFPLSYQPVIMVQAEGEIGEEYYYINDVSEVFKFNNAYGGAIAANVPENDVVFENHISNSNFTNNSASDYGGAVYYYAVEWSNITNCIFNKNSAYRGGAIYLSDNRIDYPTGDNEFDGEIYIDSYFDCDKANATISPGFNISDSDLIFKFRGEDNYLNAVYSNFVISFRNADLFGDDQYHNTSDTESFKILSNDRNQNLTLEIYDENRNLLNTFYELTDDFGNVHIPLLDVLDARYVKCYRLEDDHFRYAEAMAELNLGNFTILQILVNSLKDGETLNLTRDYTYSIGLDDNITEGVVINRTNITINANGFTINGLNKSRIFNVICDDVNFTDIIFLDGKFDQDGAILANDSNAISANGCKFINAGVNFNGTDLTFKNCEFTGNTLVKAEAGEVEISNSQFHDLHVTDSAVSINASNVVFDGDTFENNIACSLSSDMICTGGFASLINVTAGDARFSNSRFKNNTFGYLIYSFNSTNVTINNLNVTECDFSAYSVMNGIKRDIEGVGTIIGGNFTNLEVTDSRFDSIVGSRSSFLFDLDILCNLTFENSEFTNLNCPYGVMSVDEKGLYGYGSDYYPIYNFDEASVVIDNSLFENITSDYNMTCYDWDDAQNTYIWEYSRGAANGFNIFTSSKNVTLSNVCFDNVNGGFNEYIEIYSINLNLTNFTVVNSRTGADYYYGYHDIFSRYAYFLYAEAYGDLTFVDVLLDNNAALDFNQTSYNATLGKYLTKQYYSLDGGAGIFIDAGRNARIFNVNITNSVVPQGGLLDIYAYKNLTFENVLVENITEPAEMVFDKYYEDLDLETFISNPDYFNTFLLGIEGSNVEFRNLAVNNAYSTGYNSINVNAYENLSMENINVTNSNFICGYVFDVGAENATIRSILMDNLTQYKNFNKSWYDYELGRYIWEYRNEYTGSPGIHLVGGTYLVYDINVTNSIRNVEELLRAECDNITIHDLYINNITKSKNLWIKWNRNLGQYLNESSYDSGYEGGIAIEAQYVDMSNITLSNFVMDTAENFEVRGHVANIENITIMNLYPTDYEVYKFYEDAGRYITTHELAECGDTIYFGVDELNVKNMYVENIHGPYGDSSVFTIESKNANIVNLTAKNMSSFNYEEYYDAKTGKIINYCSNEGRFMGIAGENITFSNSTFSDLTFSCDDAGGYQTAIIFSGSYYYPLYRLEFDNCDFTNCSSVPYNKTNYNSYTGEYETESGFYGYGIIFASQVTDFIINGCDFIDCSSNYGGAVFYADDNVFNLSAISNSRFINCSAINGGAVYVSDLGDYNPSQGKLLITDSEFINCSAVDGGAIYISGDSSWYGIGYAHNFTVFNSKFENNTASGNGGAIYISELASNNTVCDCNFTKNTAAFNGGAIYILANEMGLNMINSSVFLLNHADYNGGAFYFNDTFNKYLFVDYRFLNRTVMFSDGVRELRGFNTQILNSRYENNTDYELKIISNDALPSQNQTVTVLLPIDATGYVEVNITDNDGNPLVDMTTGREIRGNFTLTNGTVSFNLGQLSLGSYRVSAIYDNYSYEDTNRYLFHIHNMTLSVAPSKLTANVTARNVTVFENATFDINLTADFRGKVNITVDGNVYTRDFNSTVEIERLISGNKTANVTFWADSDYEEMTVPVEFTVSKINLNPDVSIGNCTVFDNATATIGVDENFRGNVSIVVDGVTVYDGPVNSTIDMGRFASGNKTANVTFYGDENFTSKSVESNFTVSKVDLNVNVTVDDVAVNANATVNITDIPDNFNGNVSVVVDNVTVYDGPANSTIDIGKFSIGDKDSIVTFYGDENYTDRSYNVGFSVVSAILAENLTRGWMSPYDYMAKFLDANLNALRNAEVIFIINGKNYTAKTDDKGVAYLRDSKLAIGKYKVTVINPVNNESVNRTTTIVARLVENRDLTFDFACGKYFTVRAIGDDGKPTGAGETVIIKANGVSYKCKTDKNGYARLIIRLNPKSYVVTSEYKNYKVSNSLKVRQTLFLVKKTVKVKKTAKKLVLKAKLKWSNGKAIKGKTIKFIFKGKTYKAKTNKKGIAQKTLNKKVIKKLKKGKKYTFSARYFKNYVKGKVVVKK